MCKKLKKYDTFKFDVFAECQSWGTSNCCDKLFVGETDICSGCGEHAIPSCFDCEEIRNCTNPEKFDPDVIEIYERIKNEPDGIIGKHFPIPESVLDDETKQRLEKLEMKFLEPVPLGVPAFVGVIGKTIDNCVEIVKIGGDLSKQKPRLNGISAGVVIVDEMKNPETLIEWDFKEWTEKSESLAAIEGFDCFGNSYIAGATIIDGDICDIDDPEIVPISDTEKKQNALAWKRVQLNKRRESGGAL